MKLEINKVTEISALKGGRLLPPKSVDIVVTSPPYWGLRNYGTPPEIWGGDLNCHHSWHNDKTQQLKEHSVNQRGFLYPHMCRHCGAWKGELGLEPRLEMFVDHLVSIFVEAKPKLKDTANLFINLGDTYAGSQQGFGASKESLLSGKTSKRNIDLMEEFRESEPLQANIKNIKNKSLCMIPDRFALKMVENGFILKGDIQWYKKNAMPSSAKDRFSNDIESIFHFTVTNNNYFEPIIIVNEEENESTRFIENQMGSVWDMPTTSFNDAHFAVFPDELPERCIKIGCPKGGVVYDMFSGSGKTAKLAKKLGNNFYACELNPDYIAISDNELNFIPPLW